MCRIINMKLTIDAEEIINELSKKPDRKQTSLYISQSIYKDFQKDCGDTSPSQVVEMLMRLFSESRRTKNRLKI